MGILLNNVPEFRLLLQRLIEAQRQENREFLSKGPEVSHAMEAFTRGWLQGSNALLEKVLELGQQDLERLEREVEENGTEDTHERPDGGSGYY